MTEENKTYIRQLKVADVPWHRLTTAYGRGTDFPAHLIVLEQMRDLASVKKSLYVFTTNLEHQGTLWHATPFGTVFLNRILRRPSWRAARTPRLASLPGSCWTSLPASSSASMMEMRWSTPRRFRCSPIC